MTAEAPAILERLVRSHDLGWMLDLYAPRECALPFLLEQLEAVAAEYRSRLKLSIPFTPETLEAEAKLNPHKVRAFLQALATTKSPEMLVMVWRILQGLSIHEVEMQYRELDSFSLRVVLARSESELDEPYRSRDIKDASLLRHFGIATSGGKPLFDGFFPQRKR